jgi:hypothetical protein
MKTSKKVRRSEPFTTAPDPLLPRHVIYDDRRGCPFNAGCVRRLNPIYATNPFGGTLSSSAILHAVRMSIATEEQRKSWPKPNYEDPDSLHGLIVGVTVPALVLAVICEYIECHI